MRHAANRAGRAGVLREQAIPAPVLTETKDLLVEPQCTFGVSNRKVDMCESTFPVIDRRSLITDGTVLLNH